jgi:hypothetical protein
MLYCRTDGFALSWLIMFYLTVRGSLQAVFPLRGKAIDSVALVLNILSIVDS